MSHRYTIQIAAGPDSFSQFCGAQSRKGKALRGWTKLLNALLGGVVRGGQVDVAVDDGGGGTAATQTVTYSSSAGAQTITIAGKQVSFTAGASDTASAAAAVAAIQADATASRLVSAANVAGVVTLTAKTLPCSHTLANGATLAVTGTGASVGAATFSGGVNSTDAGYAL